MQIKEGNYRITTNYEAIAKIIQLYEIKKIISLIFIANQTKKEIQPKLKTFYLHISRC